MEAPGTGSSPLARGLLRLRQIRGRAEGSSPLARGLRTWPWAFLICPRIIPARAGFTNDYKGPASTCQDHPRSRGVYIKSPSLIWDTAGSSPLARGLRPEAQHNSISVRIIPARAGFTGTAVSPRRRPLDHPRPRGVYHPAYEEQIRIDGSSPLARGLPRGPKPPRPLWRIIPARAGFTGLAGGLVVGRGIIPARAGFTCWPGTGTSRRRDHPRSRGGYSRST